MHFQKILERRWCQGALLTYSSVPHFLFPRCSPFVTHPTNERVNVRDELGAPRAVGGGSGDSWLHVSSLMCPPSATSLSPAMLTARGSSEAFNGVTSGAPPTRKLHGSYMISPDDVVHQHIVLLIFKNLRLVVILFSVALK